jgi:hypothetical protein
MPVLYYAAYDTLCACMYVTQGVPDLVRLPALLASSAECPAVLQGDYEVRLKANDDAGDTLFCMLVDFTIQPGWAKGIRNKLQGQHA